MNIAQLKEAFRVRADTNHRAVILTKILYELLDAHTKLEELQAQPDMTVAFYEGVNEPRIVSWNDQHAGTYGFYKSLKVEREQPTAVRGAPMTSAQGLRIKFDWPPCTPACLSECNGGRDIRCSCQPAKDSITAQKANFEAAAVEAEVLARQTETAAEMIDLASLIKKHNIEARGCGTGTDVLCFAKELAGLLQIEPTPEVYNAEAARVVTDEDVDAALRATVDFGGCFTTPEIRSMRTALEAYETRKAELLAAAGSKAA